jgi:hypothetical protein
MDIDALRRLCLSFPGTTEQIQWGCDLLFKVHGKMFAITPLEPAPVWLSMKVTAENFVELTERLGIIPAPYPRAQAGSPWNLLRYCPRRNPALLRGSTPGRGQAPCKVREPSAPDSPPARRPTTKAVSKAEPIGKALS